MTKIIAYLRVSTDGQAEHGFGLDVQRDRITSYAHALGIVVDEFIVDDGWTGTTLDRPGMTRIRTMCAAGEIAKVIVYKFDRLSRSQRRLLELIEDDFIARNVDLVSVCEQFDTATPFGRACIGILGVFAQLDRDQVVERLANGRQARASKGERAVGACPYGYHVVDRDGRKATVVDHEQARIVRRIFSLRDDGLSQEAISHELNEAGVPGPRKGRWHQSAISTILRNSIYAGRVSYDSGSGSGPIIVDNSNLALV